MVISKDHDLAIKLGGKNVVRKHFQSLNFDELQKAFNPTSDNDEFIQLYTTLKSKIN